MPTLYYIMSDKEVKSAIDMFLEFANDKIAHYVSMSKVDRLTEFKRKSSGMSNTVTMLSLFRICRKIAKLTLKMFPNRSRYEYNFRMTAEAYMSLVTKRTPHVKYDRRSVKPPEIVDIRYYRKLFDDYNPRNKIIVKHDSFRQF